MRFTVVCKNTKIRQEVVDEYEEFMKIASKKFDYGMSYDYPSSKEVAFESVDDEVIWSFQDYLLDNLGMEFDFEDDFVFEESTKSSKKSLKENKSLEFHNLIDELDSIVNYHNKNLTKNQYYTLSELLDFIKDNHIEYLLD